ncbi:periplasmic chaperone for outer membrane proteins SurA [Modicisalibacter ilicicola DSM 19980]|uniref:Chaperone SurA n=1 Tax=Modicisalibacter ilicicola DSM 19980 TaxID=1121942 RepID=A0A1M4UEY5_9GAMM|nr:peptidylprolyl isomerase [Halomonas ilicicola]SHE55206.1 periplasmic chaperone for outer membrane proteins SurA [Halomonas ilicicola DSM 19980]
MRKRLFASLSLILTLALSAGSQALAAEPLDRIVAVVNDDAIMASELEDRVIQARSQLARRNIAVPDEAALRSQVLDRMIVEQIQLQMAEQANMSVDDTELNRAVRSIAQNNGMTLDRFADALEADGLSLAVVREQIRREMLMRDLQQRRVASRINVSDREVQRYLDQQGGNDNARYRLGHILVALPQSPSPDQVQAAQREARALYEQLQDGADFADLAAARSDGSNALEGGDLGWRDAGEIPPAFADAIPQLNVGQVSEPIRSPSGFHLIKLQEREGDARKAMVEEQRVRHILIETNPNRDAERAEALAEQARQRLASGEDFGRVAQEVSDDRGSALNGGELGWVRPGQMVPAFEEAMTSLPVGQVSQPVRSRFGYHLIEVLDRRRQDVTGEAKREQIRQTLFQRKVNDELETWMQQIRTEAYIDNRLNQDAG